MKRRSLAFCAVACLVATRAAFSTTVIAPSFDELVSKADLIFVGETVDQRSTYDTQGGYRKIVTTVTFDVLKVIKGRVGLRTQLTFLGGTVGNLTEHIAEMPTFQIGDRDVLFVSPEKNTVSPLVGFSHGRFRVQTDTDGNRLVRTSAGKPLLLGLGAAGLRASGAAAEGPLKLADFELAVRARLRAPGAR